MRVQERLRTAVIGDEVSQDLSEVIRLTTRHRFDGVEVRSVWGKAPLDLNQQDCERITTALHAANLQVAGFASPAFKMPLPNTVAERDRAWSDFERSIRVAKWLNAPTMRVFSFLRQGPPDPNSAADAMDEMLRLSGDTTVALIVETGTRTHTPSGQTMQSFILRLKRPSIGVLWDPGNSVFSGEELAPFPESYRKLAPYIKHVHIKDPEGTQYYTKLGQGSLPWRSILDALSGDAFQGFISLETHWRPNRVLSSRERDHPFGHAFSDGGYSASDQCMSVLSRILAEVHHGSAS